VLYLSKRYKDNLWQCLFEDEVAGLDEITDTVCDETPRERLRPLLHAVRA
jgi:hypothetical protein